MNIRKVKIEAQPKNINRVLVTLNTHASAKHAPITLEAGCSWADLDVESARAVIKALTAAVGELDTRSTPEEL